MVSVISMANAYEMIPDFTEEAGDNGPEEYGMAAAGDKTAPGGVRLMVTREYMNIAVVNVLRTPAKMALYLAIANLIPLNLSTDNPGMTKWHVLCLFLIFRYKKFLVLKRTSAAVGATIPAESDAGGAIPAGVEVVQNDVKHTVITKEAIAEHYTNALTRLNGILDMSSKAAIESFLAVDQLRLGMALLFSLKINFYLTNHHVGQGEFVGVGRKMWNFVCGSERGTEINHTHSAYNDAWKLGHAFSTAGAIAYMFTHVTRAQRALAIGVNDPEELLEWNAPVMGFGTTLHNFWRLATDLVVRVCQPPAGTVRGSSPH